jgi:hypothetical protein
MTKTTVAAAEFADFGNLDTRKACNTPFKLQLLHPASGAKLPGSFLHLLGSDSDVFNEYYEEKEIAEQAVAAERAVNGLPEEPAKKRTKAQKKADRINLMCALVVGWEGIVLDGNVLEFNIPNLRAFFERFEWVLIQADFGSGNLSNFMKA